MKINPTLGWKNKITISGVRLRVGKTQEHITVPALFCASGKRILKRKKQGMTSRREKKVGKIKNTKDAPEKTASKKGPPCGSPCDVQFTKIRK